MVKTEVPRVPHVPDNVYTRSRWSLAKSLLVMVFSGELQYSQGGLILF